MHKTDPAGKLDSESGDEDMKLSSLFVSDRRAPREDDEMEYYEDRDSDASSVVEMRTLLSNSHLSSSKRPSSSKPVKVAGKPVSKVARVNDTRKSSVSSVTKSTSPPVATRSSTASNSNRSVVESRRRSSIPDNRKPARRPVLSADSDSDSVMSGFSSDNVDDDGSEDYMSGEDAQQRSSLLKGQADPHQETLSLSPADDLPTSWLLHAGVERILLHSSSTDSFLVKFKGYSYLHCRTVPRADLLAVGGKALESRLRKFQDEVDDDYDFDLEEFSAIDRVLAMKNDPEGRTFLIKWSNLGFADSTYEFEAYLQKRRPEFDEKVAEYQARNEVPRNLGSHPKRPTLADFDSLKLHDSPNFKDNALFDYQIEGVNFMLFNWLQRRNCLLADEMGLGKTVQAIGFMELLLRLGFRGPYLIVAPLSTIGNWENEFRRWSVMNVVTYHGSWQDRAAIQEHEFYFLEKGKRLKKVYKFNALLTTFDVVLKDSSLISSIPWAFTVVDEAHRLKNRSSKLFEVLSSIKTDGKLLLTGTPLQNNVSELWTLFHYLNPDLYPRESDFVDRFGSLEDSSRVVSLQAEMRPFVLRRFKYDVDRNIPTKEEILVEVALTGPQRSVYKAVYERNRAFLTSLTSKDTKASAPRLQNLAMQLRKVCNHPFLIEGLEESVGQPSALIGHSGKMVLLDKLLAKFSVQNEKTLIFSQFTSMLDLMERYLRIKGYSYERLDGSIAGRDRQKAIDRFNDPKEGVFVFLLSTRAGGLGINLVSSSTVIIYDSDWNPQNDLQAQARAHRIGQQKDVKVYRLITKKTYESYLFEVASRKLGLEQAVMNAGEKAQMIDRLLRYGAYDMFQEQGDDESEKEQREGGASTDDIDSILQNAKVIKYAEDGSQGKNLLAKASFVAEEGEDASSFWERILPKEEHSIERLLERMEAFRTIPEGQKQKAISSLVGDTEKGLEESMKETIAPKTEAFRNLLRDLSEAVLSFNPSLTDRVVNMQEVLSATWKRRTRLMKKNGPKLAQDSEDSGPGEEGEEFQANESSPSSGGEGMRNDTLDTSLETKPRLDVKPLARSASLVVRQWEYKRQHASTLKRDLYYIGFSYPTETLSMVPPFEVTLRRKYKLGVLPPSEYTRSILENLVSRVIMDSRVTPTDVPVMALLLNPALERRVKEMSLVHTGSDVGSIEFAGTEFKAGSPITVTWRMTLPEAKEGDETLVVAEDVVILVFFSGHPVRLVRPDPTSRDRALIFAPGIVGDYEIQVWDSVRHARIGSAPFRVLFDTVVGTAPSESHLNATKTLKRLLVFATLRILLLRMDLEHATLPMLEQPAEWWTRADDAVLMKGVLEHGVCYPQDFTFPGAPPGLEMKDFLPLSDAFRRCCSLVYHFWRGRADCPVPKPDMAYLATYGVASSGAVVPAARLVPTAQSAAAQSKIGSTVSSQPSAETEAKLAPAVSDPIASGPVVARGSHAVKLALASLQAAKALSYKLPALSSATTNSTDVPPSKPVPSLPPADGAARKTKFATLCGWTEGEMRALWNLTLTHGLREDPKTGLPQGSYFKTRLADHIAKAHTAAQVEYIFVAWKEEASRPKDSRDFSQTSLCGDPILWSSRIKLMRKFYMSVVPRWSPLCEYLRQHPTPADVPNPVWSDVFITSISTLATRNSDYNTVWHPGFVNGRHDMSVIEAVFLHGAQAHAVWKDPRYVGFFATNPPQSLLQAALERRIQLWIQAAEQLTTNHQPQYFPASRPQPVLMPPPSIKPAGVVRDGYPSQPATVISGHENSTHVGRDRYGSSTFAHPRVSAPTTGPTSGTQISSSTVTAQSTIDPSLVGIVAAVPSAVPGSVTPSSVGTASASQLVTDENFDDDDVVFKVK